MLTRLRQLLDNRWIVRLRSDRSIREAFFVFVLTRSLIFIIFVLVGQTNVFNYPDVPRHDALISLENAPVARKLRETMSQADAAHYLGLSATGYLAEPFDVNNKRSTQYAFFPLHPLLLWLLSYVTNDVILWGAAFCNLFFFLALIFLHKLTLTFGYDEAVARRTIFYLAAFPVSYFFSTPFTESLFLLLTVTSFYTARRERWWLAGVLGLLASATRLAGVLLLPSLLVLSWQMYRSLPARKILGVVLIPFGLFAYMFYSWRLSGDALAFLHASAAWDRKPSIFILRTVSRYLFQPLNIAHSWNIHTLNLACVFLCALCIYFLARRREWALALYTLLSIVLPLSSGVLQSFERYTMGIFPVFLALGIWVKSANADQAIRFVFIFLLAIMTVLYAAQFTNALS